MNTKITLPQIVESLAELTGSSTTISEAFIRELFALITEALVTDGHIKIKNLGTFSRTESKEEPVIFIPDKDIANAINLPFSVFEAVELNDEVTDEMLCEDTIVNDIKDNNVSIAENESKGNDDTEIPLPVIETEESEPIEEIYEIQADAAPSETDKNTVEATIADNTIDVVEINEPEEEPEYIPVQTTKSKFWVGVVCGFIFGALAGTLVAYFTLNNAEDNSVISITEKMPESPIESTDSTAVKSDSIASPKEEVISVTEVYDTIRPNRYLTTMARQYYGEMNFWVYIYEENKDHLSNPDKISPGTLIRIPDASKYDIDANNPESIESAKLKAIEIYRPYR